MSARAMARRTAHRRIVGRWPTAAAPVEQSHHKHDGDPASSRVAGRPHARRVGLALGTLGTLGTLGALVTLTFCGAAAASADTAVPPSSSTTSATTAPTTSDAPTTPVVLDGPMGGGDGSGITPAGQPDTPSTDATTSSTPSSTATATVITGATTGATTGGTGTHQLASTNVGSLADDSSRGAYPPTPPCTIDVSTVAGSGGTGSGTDGEDLATLLVVGSGLGEDQRVDLLAGIDTTTPATSTPSGEQATTGSAADSSVTAGSAADSAANSAANSAADSAVSGATTGATTSSSNSLGWSQTDEFGSFTTLLHVPQAVAAATLQGASGAIVASTAERTCSWPGSTGNPSQQFPVNPSAGASASTSPSGSGSSGATSGSSGPDGSSSNGSGGPSGTGSGSGGSSRNASNSGTPSVLPIADRPVSGTPSGVVIGVSLGLLFVGMVLAWVLTTRRGAH